MTPKPQPIPYTYEKIPAYFRGRPQWVNWRYEWRDGKWTKPPLMAKQLGRYASVDNKATWSSFEDAVAAYENPESQYDGIGYAIDVETEQLVGTDLDHYLDDQFQPNGFTETAKSIVAALNSYTELSVSGKGLHIYAFGTLPPDGRRKGSVEMYSSGRYLTFTGVCVPGMPQTVEHRPAEIAAVHAQHIARAPVPTAGPTAVPTRADEEILRLARAASTRKKFDALWAGDVSRFDGDDSRADLALCSMLAAYTQDPEQLDRLMRASTLGRREKWTARSDYRESTIAKALTRRSVGDEPDELERFTDRKNAERVADMAANNLQHPDEGKDHWGEWRADRWDTMGFQVAAVPYTARVADQLFHASAEHHAEAEDLISTLFPKEDS